MTARRLVQLDCDGPGCARWVCGPAAWTWAQLRDEAAAGQGWGQRGPGDLCRDCLAVFDARILDVVEGARAGLEHEREARRMLFTGHAGATIDEAIVSALAGMGELVTPQQVVEAVAARWPRFSPDTVRSRVLHAQYRCPPALVRVRRGVYRVCREGLPARPLEPATTPD